MTLDKPAICLAIHAWNEKQIHEPADEKQATGQEPQDAGLGFAKVKTMRAGEAEEPEDVADELIVGGWKRGVVHDAAAIMIHCVNLAIPSLDGFHNRSQKSGQSEADADRIWPS